MKASLLHSLLFLLPFFFAYAEPDKLDGFFPKAGEICKNPFCKSGHSADGQSCEPAPPDVLGIVTEKNAANGELTIDITVRPNITAAVQLQTPDLPGLKRIGGNVGMKPKALAKGASGEQKLKLRYSDTQRNETLVFRVLLKNDEGKVLADIAKTVEVNPELEESDPAEEKVPVVVESGGRKLVQYMTRSQAAAQGLAPAVPRSRPVSEELEFEGGDAKAEEE